MRAWVRVCVLCIPCLSILYILNRTTAFDTANSKTGSVRETGHDPRLPFQRALQRFVELGRVLQVDHIDVSIRRPNYT